MDKTINTYNERFNSDFAFFVQTIKDPEEISRLQSVMKNHSLTAAAFRSAFPERLLNVILALMNPRVCGRFLQSLPQDSRPILLEGRRSANEYFGAIIEHPAVLDTIAPQSPEDEGGALKKKFNQPAGIEAYVHFAANKTEISPMTRCAILDQNKSLLWDFTASWSEIVGLSSVLVSHVSDSIETHQELLKQFEEANKLTEFFQEISRVTDELKQVTLSLQARIDRFPPHAN